MHTIIGDQPLKPADKLVELHLFPGVKMYSYSLANIEITVYNGNSWTQHNFSAMSYRDMKIAVIPNQVYGLRVKAFIMTHKGHNMLEYSMRLDNLILLNIANKLLSSK